MVEVVVFGIAAAVCLGGAVGVLASRNPVHAALSLVATLFGIAVLFVAQEAHFLAAVQVIVYAGAIVVLFLFVIMFLGVDEAENLRAEPLGGSQRLVAALLAVGVVVLVLASLGSAGFVPTGVSSAVGPLDPDGGPDVRLLGEALLTRYVFSFEVTSVLLTIAVVGAVVMSRMRASRVDEIVDPGQADREAVVEARIRQAEAKTTSTSQLHESTNGDGQDDESVEGVETVEEPSR